MTSKTPQDSFSAKFHDYGDLPDTPPAHIWALKALRNQLLGTRPSPIVTEDSLDEDIDEISLPPAQASPSSPSKAGILKTPGTISRRKSVTFNKSKTPNITTSSPNPAKETPKEKRTSILSRNFPGKYPSPFTPRTRHSTPDPSLPHNHNDGDTDLIPVSRSVLETLAAHVELVLENNKRLQQIIADGELTYKSYPQYNGHPDLQDMKRELEREKDVLKSLFGDFEHHQADMNLRERELNAQYNALAQQMKEQYDLQSSTANIVEDYHRAIQELNHSLKEQQERYERELDHANGKAEEMEERIRALEAELDDAKDMLRNHHHEIESRDFMIADCQDKLKRTQRQLAQLRMDTLESRVGPATKEYGDLGGQRHTHRRTTSRRSVSATSATSTNIFESKPSEPPIREHPKLESLISFNSGDEMENKIPNRALSPRIANGEEAPAPRAPGQDAIARRAAAAKRLEERIGRNRGQSGKENSYI